MKLRFLTAALDVTDKAELKMLAGSSGSALVVLADTPYYTSLESAMKIRKYVKQRNVAQLPRSMQDIIRAQMDEAEKLESEAAGALKTAIEGAAFYVDGERVELRGGDAKSKINQALEYLVAHVYSELHLITRNGEGDADIAAVLNGSAADGLMEGWQENRGAAAKMEEYLEMQDIKQLPTSMADIQSRYQAIPYGWRELDIACVAAQLIYEQKATIKYAGATIQPTDPKLPDMLRKKSEVGKTSISKRRRLSAAKKKSVKEFLREYFDMMDIPDDEDGLIGFIIEKFTARRAYCAGLDARYEGRTYPDRPLVRTAASLMDDVLSQRRDNAALIDRVLSLEDRLLDNKDDMQRVEGFFKHQVAVFDAAVDMESSLRNEVDYLSKEEAGSRALDQIRLIVLMQQEKFDYRRIPELNGLMAAVAEAHGRLLEAKRGELLEIVRQCMEAVHTAAEEDIQLRPYAEKADAFYGEKKKRIAGLESLALLDGLIPPMLSYKDEVCGRMEAILKPAPPRPAPRPDAPTAPPVKKVIRAVNRQVAFPAKRLETEGDVDAYVEGVRQRLKQLLQNCDGIQLN